MTTRGYAPAPPGARVAYRWRDPARVTPARATELAAHDAHIAELAARSVSDDAKQQRDRNRKTLAGTAQARYDKFTELRGDGVSVREAAEALGVRVKTGHRYEKKRREDGTGDHQPGSSGHPPYNAS